jgi:hypothetical protein
VRRKASRETAGPSCFGPKAHRIAFSLGFSDPATLWQKTKGAGEPLASLTGFALRFRRPTPGT